MLLVGKTLGVTREMRGNPGNQFESVQIHVLDGLHSTAVNVGRNFDQRDLPESDEHAALEVVASAYKTKDGQARVQLTATKRDREVESFLLGDSPLRAVVND